MRRSSLRRKTGALNRSPDVSSRTGCAVARPTASIRTGEAATASPSLALTTCASAFSGTCSVHRAAEQLLPVQPALSPVLGQQGMWPRWHCMAGATTVSAKASVTTHTAAKTSASTLPVRRWSDPITASVYSRPQKPKSDRRHGAVGSMIIFS